MKTVKHFALLALLFAFSAQASTVNFRNATGQTVQLNNGSGYTVQWYVTDVGETVGSSTAWNNAGNGPTSLDAGASWGFSRDSTYWSQGRSLYVRWVVGATVFAQGSAGVGQTVTVNVAETCWEGVYSAKVTNKDSKYNAYQLYDGAGNPVGGPAGTTGTVIAPGASATLVSPKVDCHTDTNGWTVRQITGAYTIGAYGNGLVYMAPNTDLGGGTMTVPGGGFQTVVNGSPDGTATGVSSSGAGTPSTYNPAAAGSGSGILFTDSTANSTVQGQGFQGVYDAITKGNADTGEQLRKLNATAEGILKGVTNGTAATSTNYDWSGAAGIAQGTNDPTGRAQAAVSSQSGQLDGILGKFAGLNTTTPSASAPNMTIPFVGGALNLDPAARFPGLQTALFAGFSFFMLLYFFYDLGKLTNETMKTMATAQTGGVPNLDTDVPVLGNLMFGLPAALIVPMVFIGLWGALLTGLFAIVSSYTINSTFQNTWSSGMGQIGWYLLSSMFPVNLFVGLVIARITLHFTIAKTVMVAGSASRFLFGR